MITPFWVSLHKGTNSCKRCYFSILYHCLVHSGFAEWFECVRAFIRENWNLRAHSPKISLWKWERIKESAREREKERVNDSERGSESNSMYERVDGKARKIWHDVWRKFVKKEKNAEFRGTKALSKMHEIRRCISTRRLRASRPLGSAGLSSYDR